MRRRKKLFAGGTAIKKQGSSRIKAPSLPAKPKNKISPAKKQVGKAIPIAKKKPVLQRPKPPVGTRSKTAGSTMAKISKSAPKKLAKGVKKPKVSGGGGSRPTSSANQRTIKQKIKRKIRTGG